MPYTRGSLNSFVIKAIDTEINPEELVPLRDGQFGGKATVFWDVVERLANGNHESSLKNFIHAWKTIDDIPECLKCRDRYGNIIESRSYVLRVANADINDFLVREQVFCARCACQTAWFVADRSGDLRVMDSYFETYSVAQLPLYIDTMFYMFDPIRTERFYWPLIVENLLQYPRVVDCLKTVRSIKRFLSQNFSPSLVRQAISSGLIVTKEDRADLTSLLVVEHYLERADELVDIIPDLLDTEWIEEGERDPVPPDYLKDLFLELMQFLWGSGAKIIVSVPALEGYLFWKPKIKLEDELFHNMVAEKINEIDRLRNLVSLSITHTRRETTREGKEVAFSVLPIGVRLHIKSFWSTKATVGEDGMRLIERKRIRT